MRRTVWTLFAVLGLSIAGGTPEAKTPNVSASGDPITINGQVQPGVIPFTLLNLGVAASAGEQSTPPQPIILSGETITWTGNAGIFAGGILAGPFNPGDLSKYFAVTPGGSITIAFGSPQTAFNILWGSVDTNPANWDQLTFYPSGQIVTGLDIFNAIPGINPSNSSVAVEISGLNPFTTVVATAAEVAFEFVPGVPVSVVPIFAGTPGKPNCHGKSVSALAEQYGGLNAAAAALDSPSVQALQKAIMEYCED